MFGLLMHAKSRKVFRITAEDIEPLVVEDTLGVAAASHIQIWHVEPLLFILMKVSNVLANLLVRVFLEAACQISER